MIPPQRLVDDPGLPDDLRADLEQAQKAHPYNQASGLAALTTKIHALDPQNPLLDHRSTGGEERVGRLADNQPPAPLEQVAAESSAQIGVESLRAAAVELSKGSFWGWTLTGLAGAALVGTAILAKQLTTPAHPKTEQASATPQHSAVQLNTARSPGEAMARTSSLIDPAAELRGVANEAPPQHLSLHSEKLAAPANTDKAQSSRPAQATATKVDADPLLSPEQTSYGQETAAYQVPSNGISQSGLKDEVAELRRIRGLAAGNPVAALTELSGSAFRDKGALQQERDALQIEALQKLHMEAAARSLAVDFLARYPNSPTAERFRCLAESTAGICQP